MPKQLQLHLTNKQRAELIDLRDHADKLRAQSGFTLRLTDFNIRPISVAGGLLKLKDEVQLSFDILAHASIE